jgi:hypothetical protein
MGVTAWPMRVGQEAGLGLGITGRLMLRVEDRVLFQAGILQGALSTEDLSHRKKSLIFGGAAWHRPVGETLYLQPGLRLGALHEVRLDTLSLEADGTRRVRDRERWSLAPQPFLGLGRCFKDRIHLEVEGGPLFETGTGGVSWAFNLGAWFKMGA